MNALGRSAFVVVRARLRRHWRSTLAVAVLVGLAGGMVLGALGGARRVETAYDRLLADIDAYDVVAACEGLGCPTGAVRQQLSELGLLESIASGVMYSAALTTADGRDLAGPGIEGQCATGGDHDRSIWVGPRGWGPDGRLPMRVEEGRPFDPDALEVLVPRIVAERVGLQAGDTLLLVGPCQDGTPMPWPEPLGLTVAGIGVGPLDVDTPTVEYTAEVLLASPAVRRELTHRGWPQDARFEAMAIWTTPGAHVEDLTAIQSLGEATGGAVVAERSPRIRADLGQDATTLRLFALLVALASALVLTPLLARQLRVTSSGQAVLSALGTTRPQRTGYGLAYAGVLGTTAAGVAMGVAHTVSHWVPRGLAETIEADPGWFVDLNVLAAGVPTVAIATVLLAAVPARWSAGAPSATHARSPGVVARLAAAQRLGPAAGTGLRAALSGTAGDGRAVPVHSGTVALAVALACVAGAQTFSAGLSELRATPRLVGWGWDAMVGLDEDRDLEELAGTPGVERVTAGTYWPLWPFTETVLVAGDDEVEVIPRAFATGPEAITPVVTDGRAAEGADELVVTRTLADRLGVGVGDAVELAVPDPARAVASERVYVGAGEGEPRSRRYEIVGVGPLVRLGATVPPVALTLDGLARLTAPTVDELSALAGQLGLDPASLVDLADNPIQPHIAYVDVQGGPDRAPDVLDAVAVSLVEAISADVERGRNIILAPADGQELIDTLERIDLSRASRVPDVLGGLFAVVSAGVLTVLVAGGVRTRRRELAVLRALGLSNRQVRASVGWQASLQVMVPIAIGVPLGIIVGQRVWRSYAESIGVVPAPTIGWPYLLALVAGALVLAIAVALVLAPGAARHPAHSLRSE